MINILGLVMFYFILIAINVALSLVQYHHWQATHRLLALGAALFNAAAALFIVGAGAFAIYTRLGAL